MPIELRYAGQRLTAAFVLLCAATAPQAASAEGSAPAPATPDDSALRAAQGAFDANGTIRCAEYAGEPMRECEFGVARAGWGSATVVVTKPDGNPLTIFFRRGRAVGANAGQAASQPDFSATKKDGVSVICIGDERYEIPDAVVM